MIWYFCRVDTGHRLVSQTCLVLIMSLLQWEGNRQYNICLSIKALKYQAIQYNSYTKHSLNISDIVEEGKGSVSISYLDSSQTTIRQEVAMSVFASLSLPVDAIKCQVTFISSLPLGNFMFLLTFTLQGGKIRYNIIKRTLLLEQGVDAFKYSFLCQ